MKRSKFSLSHYKLTTLDMGELIPVACFEVLPGDTIQHATSCLVRCSPLLAPVMHPVRVRVHHWFVPNRLIWEDWEDFITGGPDGMDASVWPHITPNFVSEGAILDYLGYPGGTNPAGLRPMSALPLRAYTKIWNEFYRDQDLQAEVAMSVASGLDATTPVSTYNCAWEKDYFTTARPWTQKGPDVTLPLAGLATVLPDSSTDEEPTFNIGGGGSTPSKIGWRTGERSVEWPGLSSPASGTGTASWADPKLVADMSTAAAVSINDLREAFAIQRYEEARARYGSRYTEYLRYLGVKSSDARLQRPEYLGGGKQTIQFSEVLQTAPGAGDPDDVVGALKGHGMGAMRSNRYRRFFEEHGWVLSLMSIVPKTMYADGMARQFTRQTKEDYFQRELQHIGQQEVLNKELRFMDADPDGTWGFQDRYDEYRRCESGISGDFRSLLNHWHLARQFSSDTGLNGTFVRCNPSKRIFAAQENDALWVMANHSIQARRLVSGSARSFIA